MSSKNLAKKPEKAQNDPKRHKIRKSENKKILQDKSYQS